MLLLHTPCQSSYRADKRDRISHALKRLFCLTEGRVRLPHPFPSLLPQTLHAVWHLLNTCVSPNSQSEEVYSGGGEYVGAEGGGNGSGMPGRGRGNRDDTIQGATDGEAGAATGGNGGGGGGGGAFDDYDEEEVKFA